MHVRVGWREQEYSAKWCSMCLSVCVCVCLCVKKQKLVHTNFYTDKIKIKLKTLRERESYCHIICCEIHRRKLCQNSSLHWESAQEWEDTLTHRTIIKQKWSENSVFTDATSDITVIFPSSYSLTYLFFILYHMWRHTHTFIPNSKWMEIFHSSCWTEAKKNPAQTIISFVCKRQQRWEESAREQNSVTKIGWTSSATGQLWIKLHMDWKHWKQTKPNRIK